MQKMARKLVPWIVFAVLLGGAAVGAAQEALQPAALVGIWSVRREVQTQQGCTAIGTRQGDQLASLWAIDATNGGTAIRVTPIGAAEGWSSYTATISTSQLQMTARASFGTTTIFLSKTSDHAMTGTETVNMGTCSVTRSLAAIRMH